MKYRAPKQIPSLDGLRAVGLCIVVFAHLPLVAESSVYNALWHINQASKIGYLLLDTFFTLSGFLITRLLLAEKVAYGKISFRRFYARRALRILPIYYLTLIACIVIFRFPPAQIASLATYTFNVYHPLVPLPNAMEHTWSLSVEEQFYFAWPFLITVLPMRLGTLVTGRIIPALAFLAALTIAFLLPLSDNVLAGNLIYMLPVTRMVSLSLGGWLAFRELEQRPVRDPVLGPMFATAIVVLVFDKIGRDRGIIVSQGVYWTISLIGYALMSSSLVGGLVFSRNRVVGLLRAALEWRPLGAFGRATYGGYLYHLPVLYYFGLNDAVVNGAEMPIARVALAVAVTAAITVVSYNFIEGPLLRMKNRMTPVGKKPAITAVPVGTVAGGTVAAAASEGAWSIEPAHAAPLSPMLGASAGLDTASGA